MMTRQQAIEHLAAKLTQHIDEFLDGLNESEGPDSEAWELAGWVPDDLARLMSRSAMAAWEVAFDLQETMKSNGVALEV